MTGRHQVAEPGPHRAGPGSSGRTPPRILGAWRRLLGSASAAAVAFALLACACSVVAVAGPRAAEQLRTRSFRQVLAASPAIDQTVYGTLDAAYLVNVTNRAVDARELQHVQDLLRTNLAKRMPLAAARSDWTGMTTSFVGFADNSPAVVTGRGTQFELVYRSDLAGNARVVAGSLPAGHPANHGHVVIQAAISAKTARSYGLRVGSRVPLTATGITLQVTGIVVPDAASSPFWQADPLVAAPVLQTPSSGPWFYQGGAFVPASALTVLGSRFSPAEIQLNWMFGLALNRLSAAQAEALAPQLQSASLTVAGQLASSGALADVDVGLTSGAGAVLSSFTDSNASIGNVLDLVSVSLAVVCAVIVLLAAWLVAEKRREEFAALRARGASRRQLGVFSLSATMVSALPGAAAGIAAGLLLTPGADTALAWWLAGLIVAVAVAGPTLITVRMHRGYAVLTRPDRPPGRMAWVRRLVVEATACLASAGGLLVLRDQQAGGANGDLYASLAPVLVAVPVAIILLRLYPLLVRPLLLIASRRSGVTAFLGLARAARVSTAAVLPAFAMVLALSLVSFAGMVRGAVIRGEVTQSWQQAGADAVITAPTGLSVAQQRAVAAVPGVQRIAALGVTSASRGSNLDGIFTVVADPAQYSALIADTPLARPPASFVHWHGAAEGSTAEGSTAAGGAVPVLASPVLAAQLGRAPVALQLQDDQQIRVYVAGLAPAMSAIAPLSGFSTVGYFVLPRSALHGNIPSADALLVAGSGLDSAALRHTVAGWREHGAGVTLRSDLVAALEKAPLQHAAYSELALGGYAAAAGCLLVLLLTLMLSAPSRKLTLARAATMGMSTAQTRTLVLVESLPQILAVLVGGLICALALVPLVGPALSLSVFTGSTAAVPVRVEPAWLTAAAIGLLVLAIATLTGQTMVAGRGVARSLRMGG